jgi:HEAT repeat protein
MTEKNAEAGSGNLDSVFAALQSDDVSTQNRGAEAAVQAGTRAVTGLLALLKEPGNQRIPAIYALARIGDSRATDAFIAALHDGDQRIRASAAQGLTRIGDSRALSACLATINDAPDELHADITPSVRSLGQMGLDAVPSLLDLLTHDDRTTRLHAQRALELILEQRHGIAGGKTASENAVESVREQWRATGNYDYSADEETRVASVAKWRRWLTQALTEGNRGTADSD